MDYASTLPWEVLLKIFESLASPIANPNSVRDLCASASVCLSWREAATEPCLWRVLWVLHAPLNARLTGPLLRNLVARSHNTLSWLRLDGCPLVNEAALARAVQQQPCLVYVHVTACALVTRAGLAYALCNAEDFLEIVAQFNDPLQSAADAQRCCVALRTLLSAAATAERAAALAEAQAANALDALLRCAALHAAHAGVQAACCWALSQYAYVAQPRLPPTLSSFRRQSQFRRLRLRRIHWMRLCRNPHCSPYTTSAALAWRGRLVFLPCWTQSRPLWLHCAPSQLICLCRNMAASRCMRCAKWTPQWLRLWLLLAQWASSSKH